MYGKSPIYALILGLLLMVSCHKNANCSYTKEGYFLDDTTLFISYEINGKPYKYCQIGHLRLPMNNTIEQNGDNILLQRRSQYDFSPYDEMSSFGILLITIIFWNTHTTVYGTDPSYWLHESIESQYIFTCPKSESFSPEDIVFFNGISLYISGGYSTENVIKNLGYDYDMIYQGVLNPQDSYFKVTNMTPACNNFYILEGIFETTVMKEGDMNPVKITHGQVRMLIR